MKFNDLVAVVYTPERVSDLQFITSNIKLYLEDIGASAISIRMGWDNENEPCWFASGHMKFKTGLENDQMEWDRRSGISKSFYVKGDTTLELMKNLLTKIGEFKSAKELAAIEVNEIVARAATHVEGLADLQDQDFNHDKAQEVAAYLRGFLKTKMLAHDSNVVEFTKFDPPEEDQLF